MLSDTPPFDTEETLVHVDWHHAGVFDNPAASARAAYYGASSAPDTYFDGQDNVVGAGDSVSTFNTYRNICLSHLAEDSKLIVSSEVDFNRDTGLGTVNVDVEVAPGETLTNINVVNIRVAIYESGILQCCEPRTNRAIWDYIGRDMVAETVLTIDTGGETQNVNTTFPLNGMWDHQNLHAIAFVQRDTNTKVLQADAAEAMFDVSVAHIDPLIASTDANPVTFDSEVTYTGAYVDDVVITLDPSGLPAGWTAELQWGATTDPTSITIPAMGNGQMEPYSVVVTPNDNTPAKATLAVTTSPASNTSIGDESTYHIFNSTEAILIVNDDNNDDNGAGEQLEAAVAAAGHFSIRREVSDEGNPEPEDLAGYDAVIWSTGSLQSATIGGTHQANLMDYLDAGGKVAVFSQGYLNHQGVTTFTSDYLRVSGFTQDAQALNVTGTPGDIADGVSFSTGGGPFVDFADVVTPNTGGVVWLDGQNGNVAVRYDSGVFQTVFSTVAFELIPNPSDEQVMAAVLDWFFPSGGVGVEPAESALSLALAQNAPNPFRDGTSVRFALPTEGPVKLSVYNVAGRKVTELVNRPMPAGQHSVAWDGRDAQGRPVAAGVYLVRLESADGTRTREMVRLK